MANARSGNKIFIDTAGAVVTGSKQPIKVAYVIFTPANVGDEMRLRETSSGPDVISFKGASAHDTATHDFSRRPLVFSNGVFAQVLSTGATATLITTTSGEV